MKQLFAVLLSIALFGGSLIAQEYAALGGAELSIRFFDRTIYYPGNSPSEPINIRLTIANNTPRTVRFKLAENHFFSIDFTANTTRNSPLEHTEDYTQKRTGNQQVYFREISLETGEEYSVTANLKDYLKIDNPGVYILQAHFFPELKRLNGETELHASSNKLTLEVRPSPAPAALKILPISPTNSAILQAESIPPDQVLNYMLTARQGTRWDQFFLYMDVEAMLKRDPAKERRFNAESENGRWEMIEAYKSEMRRENVDREIATIPVEFNIEQTSYTSTQAVVKVIQWFQYTNFREKKRFTYKLSSRDGIWRVYDYTVDNLGTE